MYLLTYLLMSRYMYHTIISRGNQTTLRLVEFARWLGRHRAYRARGRSLYSLIALLLLLLLLLLALKFYRNLPFCQLMSCQWE